MKRKLLFITLSAVLSCFSAISFAQATDQSSSSAAADNKVTPAESNKEMHLIGIIEQVDKNEINAANTALNKSTDSDVKDFANDMKSDHQKNLDDAQDLIKKLNLNFSTSPEITILAKKGATGLADLESEQGKKFDTAYAEAMVKGHAAVLNMLDQAMSKLANSNANSDFVDFVKDTQQMVAHHLDEAKELQSKLQKK